MRSEAELRGATDDVRRVVYGLRPIELDNAGLVGAIRQRLAGLPTAERRTDQCRDGAPGSLARLVTRGRARGVPDRQRGHQQRIDPLCRPSLSRHDHRERNARGHRPRRRQATGLVDARRRAPVDLGACRGIGWDRRRRADRRRVGSACTTAAGRVGGIRPRLTSGRKIAKTRPSALPCPRGLIDI